LVTARQTALGRLLQTQREAAGFSRTRIGERLGISPGTIEGWELGRVARPPTHDVLRIASFLRIPLDEIQRAVFADAGEVTPADEPAGRSSRSSRPSRPAASLLEAAYAVLGWSDARAARALGVPRARVVAWRTGAEPIDLAAYVTLASMIGLAAAAAITSDDGRIGDVAAAIAPLGVTIGATS
jgi:transcriptional regulator with XRE-family HTH domain